MSATLNRVTFLKPVVSMDHGIDACPVPTLATLSYALRHPELWPAGFKWNYDLCQSCAIGLVFRMWPDSDDYAGGSDMLGLMRLLKMSREDAEAIFSNLANRFPRMSHRSEITALHVASALDAYAAKVKQA